MNEFVNFEQRGVELPVGCTDLIDALRRHTNPAVGAKLLPAGGFGDIERHLIHLLKARTGIRHLIISAGHDGATVSLEFGPFQLGCRPAGLSALLFLDDADLSQQQAVRTVFEEAGISPFLEHGLAGIAGPMRVIRYALPNGVQKAAALIRELLEQGFGLSKNAPLWFNTFAGESG